MKRFIVLVASCVYLLLGIVNYSHYCQTQYSNLIAADTYSYSFAIPRDMLNVGPDYLQMLKKSADKNKVNILRTLSYYSSFEEQEANYDAYLYLSTNTKLFLNKTLSSGRYFTKEDMDNSSLFMSNHFSGQPNEIGVFESLRGSQKYTIYPMDRVVQNYPYAGLYQAECESDEAFMRFLGDYVSSMNDLFQENVCTIQDYLLERETSAVGPVNHTSKYVIFFFALALLSILAMFHTVCSSRETAIQKQFGFSALKISYELFLKQQMLVFLFINAFITLFIIVYSKNKELLLIILKDNFFFFLCFGGFYLLFSLCTIHFEKINTGVKGRKPVKWIVLADLLLKIILSVAVVNSFIAIQARLNAAKMEQENLSSWAEISDYGVLFPLCVGNDLVEMRNGVDTLRSQCLDFYLRLLEQNEAIYIGSESYSEMMIKLNPDSIYRDITVNTNYLEKFPIYDVDGNRILVDDNTEETIYLIPEKFRNDENAEKYIISNREKTYKSHLKKTGLARPKAKTISFVYTKEGQYIPTFSTEVSPQNNNCILDPIICVVTSKSVVLSDISFMTSNPEQLSLFVKLKDPVNPQPTYQELLPLLTQCDLEDNYLYLVQPNELHMAYARNLIDQIRGYTIFSAGLLAGIAAIIFQMIYVLFEENKDELFLKNIFGFSKAVRFRQFFLILFLSDMTEFCFSAIMLRGVSVTLSVFFVAKLIFEIAVAFVFLRFCDRNNMNKMLKGI